MIAALAGRARVRGEDWSPAMATPIPSSRATRSPCLTTAVLSVEVLGDATQTSHS